MAKKEMNDSNAGGKKIVIWIFIFAVVYAFLHITPALLTGNVKYQFTTGDLLDLFTPLVMIFLIYKLFTTIISNDPTAVARKAKTSVSKIVLILGSILFLEGHGIHLPANAIFRHIIDQGSTDIYKLTYFLDEVLSHILWDSGIILISVGLLIASLKMQNVKILRGEMILIIPSSLFFGATFYICAVEGQTVFFTFPVSILIPLVILFLSRKPGIKIFVNPMMSFVLLGYIFAFLLFIIWLVWQGGFPQFSDIGWIE